jgi:hypothetical protein
MEISIHHPRKSERTYYNGESHWYMACIWLSPKETAETKKEIQKWCYQTYGEQGLRVNTLDIVWLDELDSGSVSFNRERDLAMFLLRWS